MNNYGNNHLETPAMSGETAGTWIGFLSDDEKDAGNSVYTGKVILFLKKKHQIFNFKEVVCQQIPAGNCSIHVLAASRSLRH